MGILWLRSEFHFFNSFKKKLQWGISPAYFAGIGRNFMLPRKQWCKGAKAYFNTTSFHGKQILLLFGLFLIFLYIFFMLENFSKFLKSASDRTAYSTLLISISNLLLWHKNWCCCYYWSSLLCWKLSAVWNHVIMEQFHCVLEVCAAHGKKNDSFWMSIKLGLSFFFFQRSS